MSEKSEVILNTTEALEAAAREKQEAQNKGGERLYAGKYKTVEEMEAGYAELQKTFSSKNAPAEGGEGTDENGEPKKPESKEIPTEDEAKKEVLAAGLDWDRYNTEFAELGTLKEETFEDLEKKGFDRETVESYIDGVKLRAERFDNAVHAAAGGGPTEYAALIQFAQANYTEAQKKAFNEAVTSGKIEKAEMAVKALKASFESARGKQPNLINGKSGGGGGIVPFASQVEVTKAMRDPRYKVDPAYREEVKNRLAVSEF